MLNIFERKRKCNKLGSTLFAFLNVHSNSEFAEAISLHHGDICKREIYGVERGIHEYEDVVEL